MEGSKELLGDRTSTSLGKEFRSGWWSRTIAVHPARTLLLTTLVPLILATCVIFAFQDLDLDLMFDGFIESDHFSHNREVGRRGTNPVSESSSQYLFASRHNRQLSYTANGGSSSSNGDPSAAAAADDGTYRHTPTWRILLMYEVEGNILTASNLDIIRRYEQSLFQTAVYQQLCVIEGSAVPISSFIQYTSPTIDGDRIAFDGANTTTLTENLVAKAFSYGMQSSKIKWVFGDDLDYEHQSTKMLRSEIALGSPVAGFTILDSEDKQADAIRDTVLELRDLIEDMWAPYEASGITLYWGGDIVTESEALDYLIEDSRYAWISLLFIFVIVCYMLKSLFIALFCIFVLILSFPASILIYNQVFQQTYFGALNVLSFYIMLGIGVDDIFVYSTTFIFARRPPSAPRPGIIVTSPVGNTTEEERRVTFIDDHSDPHTIVFNQDDQVLTWYHREATQIESLQKITYMRPGVLVLGTWNIRLRPEYVTVNIRLKLSVMCKIAGVDSVGLPKKKEWGPYGKELANTLMSDVIPLAETATVEQGVVEKNHNISGSLDVREDDGCIPLDQRVAYANRKAGLALLVTSSTSTAAFLSGLVTSIPAVRSFGILMAILIVMNLIFAMTILPSLWSYWICYVRNRSASDVLKTHWYLYTCRSHKIDLSNCLVLASEGLEITQSQPSTPSMAVGEVVAFTPECESGIPNDVPVFPDYLDCDDGSSNDICDDVHQEQAAALGRSTDALIPIEPDDEKDDFDDGSTQPLSEPVPSILLPQPRTAPDDDSDDEESAPEEVTFDEPMLFRIIGLQGALVRSGQSLSSIEVADLNTGDDVLVAEIIRNRARITAPYCGWISVMSEVSGGAILGEVEDDEETEEEDTSDCNSELSPDYQEHTATIHSDSTDDVFSKYVEHATDPETTPSEQEAPSQSAPPPSDRHSDSSESSEAEEHSHANDPIIRRMCDKILWPFLKKFSKPLVVLSGTLFLMSVIGCNQLELSDNATQIFPSGHRIEKYRNQETLYGTAKACMEREISNRCAPWSYESHRLSDHTSCTGELYASDKVDPCGVCNGNGESCLGCDGTYSGEKVWACGSCVLPSQAEATCSSKEPYNKNILIIEITNRDNNIQHIPCSSVNDNSFTRSLLASAFSTDFSIQESTLKHDLPIFGGSLYLADVSCLATNSEVQIVATFLINVNYIASDVESFLESLKLDTVSDVLSTNLKVSLFQLEHGPDQQAIGFDIHTAPPIKIITAQVSSGPDPAVPTIPPTLTPTLSPTLQTYPPPIQSHEVKELGSAVSCNAFHTGPDCSECLDACTSIGGSCESNGLCRLCDQSLVSKILATSRKVDGCGICGPDEFGTWGGTPFGESCANDCENGLTKDDCGECGGNNICKISEVNAIDTSTIEVSLLWGVDAENSIGTLTTDTQQAAYDPSFNPGLGSCQSHLASVCHYFKNAPVTFIQTNATICFMDAFRDWVNAAGHEFPVPEEIFSEQLYRFLRSSSDIWDTYSKYIGYDASNNVTFIEFKFRGTAKLSSGAHTLKEHFDLWEDEVKYLNSPAAAAYCLVYQTSASWPDMFLEINALNSLVYSLCIAGLVAFGVVLVFLGDFWLTFFVMTTMLASMLATLAVFWTAGWEVGPLEAVAVSVVIGLAVDYCVHLAHAWEQLWEYLNRNGYYDANREIVVHRILVDLGLPLIAAAATTIGSTALLLACTIVPLTKFGIIMVISSSWSMIFSFFLFLPLLLVMGPSVCWRRRSEFVRRLSSIILGVAFLGTIVGLVAALEVTMDESH